MISAHNFVKSCKKKLIARKGDLDEFITQLGECLYTVQSFYSNTNWVEMFGGVAYEDFGKYEKMMVVKAGETGIREKNVTRAFIGFINI